MLLRDPGNLRAIWGRAVMACFFVISATISSVIHEQSWRHAIAGDASTVDWFYVMAAAAGALSGVAFALGRAAVVIAYAWVWYCVINALVNYPFWAVGPAGIADSASGFLSHMAVAASLMLYITHAERLRDQS